MKLVPPSSDRSIATLAQETGARSVPATFQVTASLVPPVQATAVFGAVTTNGPAAACTVTVVAARSTPPPPARLSRAVRRKVIVRLRVDIDSPSVATLPRMSESRGKVRLGVASGTNERKIGRAAATSSFGGAAVPRSYSSHI